MKKFIAIAVFLSFGFAGVFLCQAEEVERAVFQVSTINALLEGVLEGEVDFKTLGEMGDFGIGTLNDLDGEMIALEGRFYQIKSDGKVYEVSPEMKTPFSSVTFFGADRTLGIEGADSYEEFNDKLDAELPTQNVIYALKVEGEFEYIKARSVPAQEKPYPKLTEVVKTQPVFEFNNVKGTLVGFRFPEYLEGVNVPGYHFHFITEDRKAGGHVLDLKLKTASVRAQEIRDFRMWLPHSADFDEKELSQTDKTSLVKVEK